jgi:lipopolysaccharide/colanic/teichoic acid biosynthesis glycosyltransferase
MYQDADERKAELSEQNEMHGAMFKMEHDPRIIGSGPDGTRHGYGWFIRKYSIDEFPQFLNVFLGQMSLVGTRPPTVEEWQEYEAHHRMRLSVRPGITGVWQTSGRNAVSDFETVVKMDISYINDFSLGNDLRIIGKTIKQVIHGDGGQ